MDLTRQAIEKNRITAVALVLILYAGASAFLGMPQNEDPGFIIRTAQVLTFFPGASPDRVELLVTDKLEEAIQEIPELDYVNSISKSGVSEVFVNIQESETEMRPIWDDLRRKVERAARSLPEGTVGPFVNDEFGDVFGILIALTGDGFTYAELKDVADQVRNELLKIRDAAKVEIAGAQDERIFVEYSNAKLAEIGVSALYLKQVLEARNILLPGGDINTGQERIILEPSGNFESVEDLRRTILSVPGGTGLIYLEDIARVTRGTIDPPRSKVRASGVPALVLGVSMRDGGNLITLGKRVRETVRRLEQRYPIGIEFDIVAFQPEVVKKKVDDFVGNLLQAILIVTVVMLVSLGFRTGLVVSSLIPMAIVMSLLVMSAFGIGLDQISLAALIISLGLLVDNSIVMSESILVGMQEGKSPVEAAVSAARELRIPLLTSSLTTAAAFLPIYLAESTTGEYTAPLFKVVTITLLCSWVLSLTMVPMFCVYFLRVNATGQSDGYRSKSYRLYRQALLGLLRHRWLSAGGVVVIFVGVLQLFAFIPNIFFPPKDRPMFTAELELPIGTPIERTEAVVASVEAFLADSLMVGASGEEGVTNWASFIGQGPPRYTLTYSPRAPSPEYAMLLVNTSSYDIIDVKLVPALERHCLMSYPDVKPTIRSMQNGPPVTDPVEVRVSGEDAGALFSIVDEIKAKLSAFPNTKNVSDDWGARTKKLDVRIDQARARRAGLSSQDVAISLQTSLSGFETTQYREGDEIIPVTLRTVEAERKDIGKLETMNIFSQVTGRTVPLSQVADLEVVWQPSKILRRNRLKTVTVSCGLGPGGTAVEVVDALDEWLAPGSAEWPVGYAYAYGGEIEASVEANKSVGEKVPIAALVIILLLVGQFNSIRRPLIILLTIPLGLIGVILGLLAANSYFGFMTFLGVISLAGIVINNAIVLIDRINIEVNENGLDPARAVIEAGQRRLRPIVLTTCTTVGGMLPLWYGGGVMFQPMAIAIIFGLVFATALTLGVVPLLYSMLFRVDFRRFEY